MEKIVNGRESSFQQPGLKVLLGCVAVGKCKWASNDVKSPGGRFVSSRLGRNVGKPGF